MTPKHKKPWPTKEVMQQIYAKGLWGRNGNAFYSGEGSYLPELVIPYIDAVQAFLNSFKSPLRVCDLGCGDFNIGKQLVDNVSHYHAVDIVPELIKKNKEKYKKSNLTFYCKDLAKDCLPQGDLAIVRQVLQHLSNQEIKAILPKLAQYNYILLTEHLPKGSFVANKDIISGQGIRLKKQSGVDLLKEPFLITIKKSQELLSISSNHFKGKIVTTLYHTA